MIRHPISEENLRKEVDALSPKWRKRANKRTQQFLKKGYYDESKSIWSEIKEVYMVLQESKCAYCERKLEKPKHGKVEQDVDHFRPKGNIGAWEIPDDLISQKILMTSVPAAGKGYHLLSYHLLNYAATCKTCNSILKSDYFPIAGQYSISADDPRKLAGEQAYLIYPISDIDDNPEDLIEFYGVSPQAVAKQGHARNRALVTIAFFKLDDIDRVLLEERARIIVGLYPWLQKAKEGKRTEKEDAEAVVAGFLNKHQPHLNCAKSFVRLFAAQPDAAKQLFASALKLFERSS